MEKIDINIFVNNLSDFELSENSKLSSTVNWLENILKIEFDNKNININMLMPKKSELAELLNVGLGTIQNAYRLLEDKGILLSKQCIGTIFINNSEVKCFKKMTSKKDVTLNLLKKHIKKNLLKVGDEINSVRYFAKKLKVSSSLILQVFEQMENLGILENKNGIRILKTVDFEVEIQSHSTLSSKLQNELKDYILKNCKVGDKLPSVVKLSKIFNVSVKTVHSALKKFMDDEVLISLSGRYGTTVVRLPIDNVFYQKPETSMFASSKETYYYHYEKILTIIRKMIVDNFQVGSKLPSISELALLLDVNQNTIRKSFEILKDDGLVTSVRGRYGGTFVLELPDLESTQSYQWLAVNSDFSI